MISFNTFICTKICIYCYCNYTPAGRDIKSFRYGGAVRKKKLYYKKYYPYGLFLNKHAQNKYILCFNIYYILIYIHAHNTRTLIYIIYIGTYYDCIRLPVSLSPIIQDRIARTPRQKHVIYIVLRWASTFRLYYFTIRYLNRIAEYKQL